MDLLPLPEQPSTIQVLSPDIEVSAGADKGKEVQPPMKINRFKDALIIRDVVSKAKKAESKSKAGDTNFRQLIPRRTLTKQRYSYRTFLYFSLSLSLFCCCCGGVSSVCSILSF